MQKYVCIFISLFGFFLSAEGILQQKNSFQFYPKTTWVAITASNIDGLLKQLGKDEIIQKHRKLYQKAVINMEKSIFMNLLQSDQLLKKGIDATKPCSFGVLDGMKGYIAFSFALNDKAKFISYIKQVNLDFLEKKVGDVDIIHENSQLVEIAFLLRKNYVTILIAEMPHHREGSLDFANELANMTDENSLVSNDIFQECAQTLNFGKDAGAYINIDQMLKSSPWGQNEEFIDQMAGKMGLAIGAQLQKNLLQYKSFFHVEKNSMLHSFFKDNHVPNLLFALDKSPLQYYSFALDIPSILEFAGSFFPPQNMEKLDTELRGMFEMSFSEIATLLNGNLAFAVSGDINSSEDMKNIQQKLDVSLTIGITNNGKIKSLLKQIIAKGIAPLRKNEKFFTIEIPEWKTFTLAVTNSDLVISNSESVIKNMLSPKTSSISEQLIATMQPSMIFSFDMRLLGYYLLYQENIEKSTSAMEKSATSATAQKSLDIPFSQEYKNKQKEIDELNEKKQQEISVLEKERDNKFKILNDEANKKEQENSQKETSIITEIINRFGKVTVFAKKVKNGIHTAGGIFFDISVKDVSISTVDNIIEMQKNQAMIRELRNQYWQKRDTIYQEYYSKENELNQKFDVQEKELQEELQQIREKDIREYNNK